MSWDDEDDEEGFLPDSFLAEIDNLVAQHNNQSSKVSGKARGGSLAGCRGCQQGCRCSVRAFRV